MDNDDDVEHLFSWLQTPDLRYREFAGAREITDAVITQARPMPSETPVAPAGNTQLREEYPADQLPDQRDAPEDVVVQAPPQPAPTPMTPHPAAPPTYAPSPAPPTYAQPPAAPPTHAQPPAPPPLTPAPPPVTPSPEPNPTGPFALGPSGRHTPRRPHYEEPVVPPQRHYAPPPHQAAPPPPVAAPPAPPPSPTAPPAGGGLLGGAYRENGANGHGDEPAATNERSTPADSQQRSEHSLDAVFGRLAGGRNRLPDPRERLRHIPGLGPSANRSR